MPTVFSQKVSLYEPHIQAKKKAKMQKKGKKDKNV